MRNPCVVPFNSPMAHVFFAANKCEHTPTSMDPNPGLQWAACLQEVFLDWLAVRHAASLHQAYNKPAIART
jgi:hypothetical protein